VKTKDLLKILTLASTWHSKSGLEAFHQFMPNPLSVQSQHRVNSRAASHTAPIHSVQMF
jgi:hypothetical protein